MIIKLRIDLESGFQ